MDNENTAKAYLFVSKYFTRNKFVRHASVDKNISYHNKNLNTVQWKAAPICAKNNKENVYLINVTCMEDNIEFGCFRGTVFFFIITVIPNVLKYGKTHRGKTEVLNLPDPFRVISNRI